MNFFIQKANDQSHGAEGIANPREHASSPHASFDVVSLKFAMGLITQHVQLL